MSNHAAHPTVEEAAEYEALLRADEAAERDDYDESAAEIEAERRNEEALSMGTDAQQARLADEIAHEDARCPFDPQANGSWLMDAGAIFERRMGLGLI